MTYTTQNRIGGYNIEKNMMEGERLIAKASLHWIVFLGPIILALIIMHASSVKTGMHRIGPLEFFMPNSAIKARAHRGLISIDFEFWHNYKVQNEILI